MKANIIIQALLLRLLAGEVVDLLNPVLVNDPGYDFLQLLLASSRLIVRVPEHIFQTRVVVVLDMGHEDHGDYHFG